MFWGYFAASGTGCLDCVNGIMNSDDYQNILGRNVVWPVSESCVSTRGHGSSSSSRTMTRNTLQKSLSYFLWKVMHYVTFALLSRYFLNMSRA